MSENSGISWTTHTLNPWWGCQKVHAGCANCYAETLDHRWGGSHWGKDAPRRMVLGEWGKPEKWNREAQAAGKRARVFCASMADLFEDYDPCRPFVDQLGQPIKVPANLAKRYAEWLPNEFWTIRALRRRVFDLVEATPWLDWLLLTKRPENVLSMVPEWWSIGGRWPRNAMLGTSPCNDATAAKSVPELMSVGGKTGCRTFLSCEPLLGALDLEKVVWADMEATPVNGSGIKRVRLIVNALKGAPTWGRPAVAWVIVGAESDGPRAGRNADKYNTHAAAVIEACGRWGVPVFNKQAPLGGVISHDPAEWPEPLRVRQFPNFEEFARVDS